MGDINKKLAEKERKNYVWSQNYSIDISKIWKLNYNKLI
jgi:hypothetical protein